MTGDVKTNKPLSASTVRLGELPPRLVGARPARVGLYWYRPTPPGCVASRSSGNRQSSRSARPPAAARVRPPVAELVAAPGDSASDRRGRCRQLSGVSATRTRAPATARRRSGPSRERVHGRGSERESASPCRLPRASPARSGRRSRTPRSRPSTSPRARAARRRRSARRRWSRARAPDRDARRDGPPGPGRSR